MALTAVFSKGYGTFMVAVTKQDPYIVLAEAHPGGDENPLQVLAELGYRVLSRDTVRSFPETVRATGYRNVYVTTGTRG